ncbi:MAG TPA: hypothetical protein VHZ56_03225 [Devosia sp.]|jgi:hypothetical protein|nr:hypothetical protein [Devosia sp.]
MRLLLRIVGTLLIACAVILLIIDGTKSLGSNAIVLTPLGDFWTQINAQSLETVKGFFATRLFGPLLETVVSALLGFPGWAVIGVPGILLAWAGRSRRERVFLRQDQI